MNDPEQHWLKRVPEVVLGCRVEPEQKEPPPLTFLLGAGASLSSGGPRTVDILTECKRQRPDVFPTDEAVYDEFSQLTSKERDRLIRPLFKRVQPYVGYRCLAAMAKSRPIFIVDLNWDGYIKKAADLVDVPVARFDLKNVAKGRLLIDAAEEDGCGIVCAHVHGYLNDEPRADENADDDGDAKWGIRFSRPDTIGFGGQQLQLLEELLTPFTIIVGTSLVGPRDAHEMLQALLPSTAGERDARATAEPLWVFERGNPSRAPGFGSKIAVGLSNALLARNSIHNFVSNPNVDFDMLLTALRAAEADLPWADFSHSQTQTRLPSLDELIPPDPVKVFPLLDRQRSLIIGAPYVGSSTLAYLVAWWRCLFDVRDPANPPEVKGFQGPGPALDYLKREGLDKDQGSAVVIHDLFDERDGPEAAKSLRTRLAKALEEIGDRPVLATASPDAAMAAACKPRDSTYTAFEVISVCARTLWRPEELRAWAKARGGDWAELVCREVRMGLISTPAQAVRTLDGHTLHEETQDWRDRLYRHLVSVYAPAEPGVPAPRALALAMLRLQDFSTPRSAEQLAGASGAGANEELLGDPWGLCAPIKIDGELYLRLSNPDVIQVVDAWISAERGDLEKGLRDAGEPGLWAIEALARWKTFREAANEPPENFEAGELELVGSEYVRRSLQHQTPELAVEALWRTWESRRDRWAAKDVALDLVSDWEQLGQVPRARILRDRLLKSKEGMGAYALFEAIMRVGRPTSLELWAAVVNRLLDLAKRTSKDRNARRQVLLAFAAILWRKGPISPEQERKLIDLLLAAAREDDRLYAGMAAACAYHFEGNLRLQKAEFDLPMLAGTDFDLPAVTEMAWLVAWYFAHQSRCRALASRRTFLSTVEPAGDANTPRYLDRVARQDELDAEHRNAVVRFVGALLHHSETAGWALHLIMNIHATTGRFRVPKAHIARLHQTLRPSDPDPGVLSAALTYKPSNQIYNLLSGMLRGKSAERALERGLYKGVPIEGTDITEPRFSLGADPWEIRERWDAMPNVWPFEASVPQDLIGDLASRIEKADEEGKVDRAEAEHALAVIARGHTVGIESYRRSRLSKEEDYVTFLGYLAKFYARHEDEWA